MKLRSYILGIAFCFPCFLQAQLTLEKSQSFSDRLLYAGFIMNEGRPDTVYVFDPEELSVYSDASSTGTGTKKTAPKPVYIKWNKGRKILKKEEVVVGIGNNRILIKTKGKTNYRVQSYVLKGALLEKRAELTIENIDFSDRIDALYSPSGNLYVVHHRNTFAPAEGKKMEMFDTELKRIMSYDYRYGIRVNYSFVNNDTLCLYEADNKNHKIGLETYSLSQHKVILNKEVFPSWDFNGLPQVMCIITHEGYVIAANSSTKNLTYITAFRNNGDTIWSKNIDDGLDKGYYLPNTNELLFLSTATRDIRGAYQLILAANDGHTVKQQYFKDTFLKEFVETKAEGNRLMYTFFTPVTLTGGSRIAVPIYCYTQSGVRRGTMLVLIIDGKGQEFVELPMGKTPDYNFYPEKSNKLIFMADKKLLLYWLL